MKQLRVNVTDSEYEYLEQKAEELNIPINRCLIFLIDEKMKEPEIVDNYSELKRIDFWVPDSLLQEIDKAAESMGLKRSRYMALLLGQKKPIMLTYSEQPSAELSMEMKNTMDNINSLAEVCAKSNGKLYEGEMRILVEQLNRLYPEMLKAISQVNKNARKNYKKFYSDIYGKQGVYSRAGKDEERMDD